MSTSTQRTPGRPTALDLTGTERHDRLWGSSSLVGLGFATLALLYSFCLSPLIRHGVWFVPDDIWAIVDGGRFVWHGALGYVYQGTSSYALPLSFIVTAPISGLVDHFHLIEGSPLPIARPSAWLVVGPFSLCFGIFFVHALRHLAWDLGLRSRLLAVQILGSLLFLLPAFEWGHFEDIMAMIFVLHAVRSVVGSRYLLAAVFVGLAVSSKQWAIPLIPFLVFSTPVGGRVKSAVVGVGIPGLLGLFPLLVDWSDTSKALFAPVNLAPGQTEGHVIFYATWLGSNTSALSRPLGGLGACLLAVRLSRTKEPQQVLAAVSAVLAVRFLAEAISYSYYWSPALVAAGLMGVAAHKRVRAQDWIGPVAVILWATPRGNLATAGLWWCGESILLGLAGMQVVANATRRDFWDGPALLVKKCRQRPILKAMFTATAVGDTSWMQ